MNVYMCFCIQIMARDFITVLSQCNPVLVQMRTCFLSSCIYMHIFKLIYI